MLTTVENKRVTIKDVAKLAGVTAGTVSLALNRKRDQLNFSQSTIDKIHEAAKKLSYRPNQFAKRLVEKCDYHPTIAVMTPLAQGFGGIHNTDVLNGILASAASRSVHINVRNTNFDELGLPQVDSIGRPDNYDGIILHTWLFNNDDSVIDGLLKLGRPFVLTNHYSDDPRVPCVGGDMTEAGEQAVSYLAGLGHTRISAVLGPNMICKIRSFYSGIKQGAAKAGIAIPDNRIIFGDYENINQLAFEKLFAEPEFPTAIITASDMLAVKAMNKLKVMGLSVPNDVSIVGFGNDFYSEIITPKLTTFDEKAMEIGQRSLSLLMYLIEGRNMEKKQKLKFEMIERGTCAVYRRG